MNLLFTLPLISLTGGILTLIYHFRNQSTNLLTNVFILISFLLSVTLVNFIGHPQYIEFPFTNVMGKSLFIKLQIDNLSIIMLLLINFVSFIIHRYATSYLASDVTHGRFMAQLSILSGAVSLLALSGNLFTAFLAWQFVGFSLYLLLNHYHYDSNANKAAKKKFIINRIGDFCFLSAVILCYKFYGNSDFDIITTNYAELKTTFIGMHVSVNTLIVVLVLMAVMTKSAQFPFHIWLPDTMQAPTPVSAIMHAGIINSGGFLLTRISPMIAGNLFLTDLIFTIGIITFICASFFILTQSDVKKQLAYSTMGQMGFMIMQCGLGLYAAAIFHLIAHGFFKAFLFLSAGNNLLYKEKKADHQMAKVLLSIIFSLVILAGYYFYVKTTGNSLNSNLIMAIFISITLAQILAEIFVMQFNLRNKILAIAVVALVFAMYMLLVNSTETILSNYINLNMLDSYKVIIGLTLLIVQIGIWLIPSCTNILPEKLTLWVYHLSRNKLFVEDGYRKYLLNPYRHFGDYLNKIFCQYHEVCFILLAFVASFYTYLGFSHGETFASPYNILINQVIYFVMLIAANRALNIDRLNLYLFVSQISLINIGLFGTESIEKSVVLFQVINSFLVFSSINILLRGRSREISERVDKNLLSLNSSYFSFLLFLLIGLPGTASFISELNILLSLASDDLIYIFLTGVGFLLLAIAIMHALQEHVFNSKSIFLPKNIYLTSGEQLFILFAILINISSGVYPDWLLNQLEWFLR
ncbi:MAG: hypothetical protein E6Q33_07965 [Neisseriales bacterium]|nr:MAG: hypothetical protein E6Q33_07965 [Neisseriales bacterium]